ncbi:MAG TPA: Ig-like domain-containing protein [Mycobacteriales bacterium]|nr:Ig-like domain-containing protein [Mycobacteriales bacterium]
MSVGIRRICGAVAAALIAGVGCLGVGVAHASSTPPWEPDANSVGGLEFFDSSGNVVTGGNVNDPIAAYVQGTATIRTGDTVATLSGYLPKNGQAPGAWSGEQLAGPSTFPNASAPSAVSQTLPVLTGNPGTDFTVATLVSDFPNTDASSDGYAGLYQLRLRTSASGKPGNTTYDSADIAVTGGGSSDTWSLVYPQAGQATTTTLGASPSSVKYGGKVTLTASVTPTTATGSVQFLDGTTVLATKSLSAGSATYTTTSLGSGKHHLSAAFVPTDSSFAASTSAAKSVTVTPSPTTVTVRASAAKVKKGKKLTLSAAEKPAVAGKAVFFDGSKKLASVSVKKGRASYTTTKLAVGKHKIDVTFTPSDNNHAASTSKTIMVTVTK